MADTTVPAPPAPAPSSDATAAAPAAPEQVPALPTRDALIAKSIAAGRAALAAEAASTTAPVADPVADIPPPPAQAPVVTQPASEPPKVEEAKPDPVAALVSRFESLERQNSSLLEQLAKLTAKPGEAPKPEPEKAAPTEQTQRTLTDSPFEAQARVYFGDLPKPLLTQATEVLEKRHSWQSELRAAETALAGGDAAARERINQAQYALGKVQGALERIEFDASLAKQARPQPVAPQAWGVVARDEFVDAALSDRANWKPAYQSLDDHEVAAVLRGVPAGASGEDYVARAEKALDAYVSKRKPTVVAAPPASQPAAPSPKNPAPPAPPKPETTISGEVWRNDEILPKHEHMRRIIARGRGDAPTN